MSGAARRGAQGLPIEYLGSKVLEEVVAPAEGRVVLWQRLAVDEARAELLAALRSFEATGDAATR
jgi:hypothetical protein